MAYIKDINSLTEYQGLIRNSPPMRLVVIDFFAVWCGPCHAIADTVKRLSEQNRHVTFAKVDVDRMQDVSRFANVTTMPTFKFFKSGHEVAELVGADQRQLEALIKQHGGEPDGDKGITIQGHTDINELITMNQTDCLNEQAQHTIRSAFSKDDFFLESDVDEQLLISVPFSQAVKVHSIKIAAPDVEHAPRTIKIFVNRLNLGFDDADSIASTQTVTLDASDYEDDNSTIIPLRFVKFQNVTNVSLFVQDNIGDELTTQIKEIVFVGSPAEATKIENLQKIGEPGSSK